MRFKILILTILYTFVLSYANPLKEEIESLIKDQDVAVGIYVESLATKSFKYILNEKMPFIPASNQKILTTATAIINLTPDYRFKTTVLTDGFIKDGVLKGNLYLKGGADPSLSEGDLKSFADYLKQLGISKIEGNIIGDDSFFSEEGRGHGWPEKDFDYCFTAPFSALSVNENCLRLEILSDKKNTVIKMYPDNDYFEIVNNLELSKKYSDYKVKVEGRKIYLFGKIKPLSKVEVSIPVENPSLFTTSVLYKVIKQSGIKITGKYYIGKTPSNTTVIITHKSQPLKEIIKKANKDSNNFYAEQIFRTLGKEILGKGDTETSATVVINTLKRAGIDVSNIRIYDGSGLSRFNQITPESISKILSYMYNTPYFFDFYQSLAVAGTDGTLKHRFKDVKGKIYAKTGYIKGVKNLSGYILSDNGEVYVFSILVNNLKSTEIANKIQESICLILANGKTQL
ncbi:D-alanyl-D-alanine carboxypeptidase/D-alanyl-D-alanine endopeptidase [Sulfurihydrogenibium subterraneum]|uniref:D-alanyl-D-alanine carboxypeptidase/D-alanyl-D-alanine endopeptidase n=1 Tax=Sulfurihydrogenibium subterraneum TaxID=171121 RepID=UPI00048B3992|nr:D-alanyl-D-alanine carboxypeptidase/D-alanyl-D-alanine-endopeptidase [Sulfurihydrogenibium subterraneum]